MASRFLALLTFATSLVAVFGMLGARPTLANDLDDCDDMSVPEIDGLLEGGVPIMVDGHCLGAVGVSGVKSTEDAQIAKAGIAALGI